MKLKLYFIGIAGFLGFTALGIYCFDAYHRPAYHSMDYASLKDATGRADYNAQYYHLLRADRNGQINFKDVLMARNEVRNFVDQKNAASSLVWDYMGPDYVGGRCRAIHQDNQKTNSALMYAGGVSGGFFISFDGGENWHDATGDLPNLAISCITQSKNGVLFVGTGSDHEGLQSSGVNTESGHPGDGLFRRDVSGNGYTFTRLVGPSASNLSPSADWRFINQIAASPVDQNKLFVGSKGLWYSTNALASDVQLQQVNTGFTGVIDDIVLSNDGQFIYFTSGANVYKYQDDGTNITLVNTATLAGGVGAVGRAMIAISPDDNNILYAAVSNNKSNWDATGCLFGIYQSRDAGVTWKLIGPGGTYFDPYANPGTNCQGHYDNTVAVFRGNPGKIIVGGVQLWQWEESANTPGIGGWSQIAITQGGSLLDPNYVHADKHRILCTTPNTVFIASDGGIAKSIDGGQTWTQNNLGFNITQFYTVAAAPAIEIEFQGQTFITEQIIGGTQDNGTQLVGTNGARPRNSFEIKSGDGFDCAFSALSNLAYATIYNGDLSRHSFGNPAGESFFDPELDTACQNGCGTFYTRFCYWERPYVSETFDSVLVHINSTINIGDSIKYHSAIGGVPMGVKSTVALNPGDSLMLPDFAQSRLAFVVGTDIYMTRDAAKLNTVNFKWDRIASSDNNSYPDALSGSVFSMDFSGNGDHLFLGMTNGSIYRISNLNYGFDSTTLDVRSPGCVLTCTKIGDVGGAGGVVTSIAADPNDANNIVFTVGGFTRSAAHVYRVTNAATTLTDGANIVGIQGNLPQMPVYSVIVADHDENTVLVGTEFGVYGTDNGFTGTPTWSTAHGGMPIVPVYDMVQLSQEYIYSEAFPDSKNANFRKVYAGTCGRGFYRTTGLVGMNEPEKPEVAVTNNQVQLKVYPNPASTNGTIELYLTENYHTTIQVFDLNGKLVTTLHNATLQGGKQRIHFDVTNFQSGTYMASVRTSEGMKVAKFVVVK